MSASPSIRPLGSADLSAFFAYLNAHLQDNGRDGAPLFQPMSRAHPVFPADKIIGFTKGLSLAVGGLDWIDLEVLSAYMAALGLYRDSGFVQTGEIADMFRVDGERLDYVFMARRLHTLVANSD